MTKSQKLNYAEASIIKAKEAIKKQKLKLSKKVLIPTKQRQRIFIKDIRAHEANISMFEEILNNG